MNKGLYSEYQLIGSWLTLNNGHKGSKDTKKIGSRLHPHPLSQQAKHKAHNHTPPPPFAILTSQMDFNQQKHQRNGNLQKRMSWINGPYAFRPW